MGGGITGGGASTISVSTAVDRTVIGHRCLLLVRRGGASRFIRSDFFAKAQASVGLNRSTTPDDGGHPSGGRNYCRPLVYLISRSAMAADACASDKARCSQTLISFLGERYI